MSKIRERLAEICHKQWAGWMIYLISKCTHTPANEMIIPEWAVERWKRQIATNYKDLTEDEKISDRIEADKFLREFEKVRTENAEAYKLMCIFQQRGFNSDEENLDLVKKFEEWIVEYEKEPKQ